MVKVVQSSLSAWTAEVHRLTPELLWAVVIRQLLLGSTHITHTKGTSVPCESTIKVLLKSKQTFHCHAQNTIQTPSFLGTYRGLYTEVALLPKDIHPSHPWGPSHPSIPYGTLA